MLMENAECNRCAFTTESLGLVVPGRLLVIITSYLHRFPINALKIDRSFVNRMGCSDESYEIVRDYNTGTCSGMD